jgi:hypothetical protein
VNFPTKGLSIALSLVPLLLALGALPVQASAVGVLVAPARIDLAIKPADTTLEQDLSVTNQGGAADTFTVSAVDLVIVAGIPEVLPASSTPYSAAAVATLRPSTLTLAAGKSGTIRVSFDVSGHKPLLGGLLVVPGQQGSAGATGAGRGVGISTAPQALVIVSAGPVDATGELLPAVQLGVSAVDLKLSGFIDSGPINVSASLRDSGNVYERVFSTYEFSNLGRDFLTVKAPPSSAMPGKTTTTSATTRQRLEGGGQAVDTAPWLCVCQVRVSTVAWLADRQTVPAVVQTRWVVIFPWRVAGTVLGLLALLVVARWLWRRRSPLQER